MQRISEVMSSDVQTISPDATIEEAAQEMRDGDFGLLPVGDEEQLLGVITDRDIAIRAVAEGRGPSTPVSEIMSEDVIWAHEDDSIEEAAEIMSDNQIRRLPVVNAEQRLVGIVSLSGILQWMPPISDRLRMRLPKFPIRPEFYSGKAFGLLAGALSLPFYGGGRLSGDVVNHAVYSTYFVNDTIGYSREQSVG